MNRVKSTQFVHLMNKIEMTQFVYFESFPEFGSKKVLRQPARTKKSLIPSSIMNKLELEYGALKVLQQQPDMTQREIAEELNVSSGKT